MRIRARLASAFVSVALPIVVVISSLAYINGRQSAERAIIDKLNVAASDRQRRVEGLIEGDLEKLALAASKTNLRLLVLSYLAGPNAELLGQINRNLSDAAASVASFASISVSNLAGEIIASSRNADVGRRVADIGITGADSTPPVIRLVHHRTERPPALLFGRYLLWENRPIGWMWIESRMNDIQGMVSDTTGMGKTGKTYLVCRDESGDALLITPLRFDSQAAFQRKIGQSEVHRPAIQVLLGTEKSWTDVTDYRGEPIIAATRYIKALDWGLVTEVDKAEAFASVKRLGQWFATITFLFSLLLIVTSVVVARSIVRPVDRLTEAAIGMSNGDFSCRVPVISSGEMGVLQEAFNQMAQRLADANMELERKVQERTKELNRANLRLQREVAGHEQAEQQLYQYRSKLEEIVKHRTRDLQESNSSLQQEVDRRQQVEDVLTLRGRYIAAVAQVGETLLSDSDSEGRLDEVLQTLGDVSGASRCYLFQSHQADDGASLVSLIGEWCAHGIKPQIDNPEMHNMRYREVGFERWHESLSHDRPVVGRVDTFPASERRLLEAQGAIYVLVLPLWVNGALGGLIGFSDLLGEQVWGSTEIEFLRSAARIISLAIERRQAVASLHESREVLHATVESTADGILVVDEQGKVIHANRRFVELWRIPGDIIATGDDNALLSFVLDQLTDPDAFLSRVKELYQSSSKSRDTVCFKDGRVFDRFSCPLIREGRPAGRVWSFTDITEHKRTEEALRESEERLKVKLDFLLSPERGTEEISLVDLIDPAFLQQIQDSFARVTGVASIIVDLEGKILTKPSNFSEVCSIVQATDEGLRRCTESDRARAAKAMGVTKPIYHRCLSCGFADASAPIIVAGRHIANWLMGQVNVFGTDRSGIEQYAREIGADVEQSLRAFDTTQPIPPERFEEILNLLWHLAQEISTLSYNNLLLARDIGERRRTELALRQSEERFRAIADYTLDWENWFSPDGKLLWVNPGVERVTGYTVQECLAMPDYPLAIIHEQDRPLVETFFQKGTAKESGRSLQTRLRKKDGSIVWMETHWQPIYDPRGEWLGYRTSSRDVTERVLKQMEIKKLSAAVQQSANVIMITDPGGYIQYVNPQFSRVTGYEPEEVLGRRASVIGSGTHNAAFFKDLWDTISSDRIWVGNIQNRRKNGELFWEHTTITAVHDDGGNLISYLAISEDITRQLRTQEQLAEAHKLSAIGTLAAGVAHEFRNHLGGIIGNASFALEELDRKADPGAARDAFNQVIELAEKANDIALSLMSYSDADPEAMKKEDLAEVIGRTVRLVEKEMKSNWIDVITRLETVPPATVSAPRIQELLLNLLVNARQAIGRAGSITITLCRRGDQAVIEVRDTGSGICRENLGKVFDPFFSTKGVWGKDDQSGMGLGLSICRNVAREHGGDIKVESTEGVGTTFTVTLPLDRPHSGEVGEGSVAAVPRRQKVLLFTLNNTIAERYRNDAAMLGVRVTCADSLTEVESRLAILADLVIGDASFSAKMELYRLVNACRTNGIPYVLINCGIKDYQLGDIFSNALACHEGSPGLAAALGVKGAADAPAKNA